MPATMTSQDHFSSSQQQGLSKFWLLPEILTLVRSYVSQSDFATLCLVCRSLHNSANRVLYEQISLEHSTSTENDKGTKAISTLQASLARYPELGNLVRSIHTRSRDYKILPYIPPPPEIRTHIFLLSDIIKRCPKLRQISVSDRFPIPASAFTEMQNALSHANSLSHLKFDVEDSWPCTDLGGLSINETTLIHVLGRPALRRLELTVHEGLGSPLHVPALPTSHTITRLRLLSAYVGTNTLRSIVAAVPRVRHLDISLLRLGDDGTGPVSARLDLAELGAALTPAFPTVETLKLAIIYESRGQFITDHGGGEGSKWGPFGVFPSLQPCTKLKSLEITPEVLSGWDGGQAAGLARVQLPDALEELLLRYDFGEWYHSPWREFPNLCASAEEFLKSPRCAQLKRFALTAFEDDCGDEMDARKSITQVCNDLGLRFSFNIVEPKCWGI